MAGLSVVPGDHNVSNALAAIAAGGAGDFLEDIPRACTFTGTDRRFQYKGTVGALPSLTIMPIIPQKSSHTAYSGQNYPHRKTLWCVFQPHTYTRTPKPSVPSLPRPCHWRTKWFWLIFMLPGKRILWGSVPESAGKRLPLGTECVLFSYL